MNRLIGTALVALGATLAGRAAEPGSDADIATAKPAAALEAKDAGMAKPRVELGEAKSRPVAVAPTKVVAPANADIQDVVYRSSEGLKWLRLHVQVDGKPASLAWNSYVDKLFAYYDRNDDKFLSQQEVARLPHPTMFSQGFNLIFSGGPGRGMRMNFAELDANKDGKVSREEFRAHARKTGFAPVQVLILPPQATAQQLTDAFYKHVNAKNDGKLTKSDLARAWERLARLDTDEDEIVSTQELLVQPSNPYFVAQPVEAMSRPVAPQLASPFVSLPVDWTPDSAADLVMAALDRDKVALLPYTAERFEPSLPQFVRAMLRSLEREHVKALLARPADLELTVHLGNIAEGVGRLMSLGAEPAGMKPYRPGGKTTALEKFTKLGSDGVLRLTLSDAIVEFGRNSALGNRFDGTANYYTQQFKMAAGDKKYATKQELLENPQLQIFANVFDDLDRNGDGKLTIPELQASFDLFSGGPRSQVYVTVVDQGRGLVDLIDANHDGRITRRELLSALKNFSFLDKNGDGAIERTELPSQYRLTASQGPGDGRFGVQFVAVGFGGMRQVNTPTRGPVWFRKMDRNGDGDVSEREFLGTPEEFKAIDTDGDGLISLAEAERFDAARKQQAAAKK